MQAETSFSAAPPPDRDRRHVTIFTPIGPSGTFVTPFRLPFSGFTNKLATLNRPSSLSAFIDFVGIEVSHKNDRPVAISICSESIQVLFPTSISV